MCVALAHLGGNAHFGRDPDHVGTLEPGASVNMLDDNPQQNKHAAREWTEPIDTGSGVGCPHIEYVEQSTEYGILFIFNLFCEYGASVDVLNDNLQGRDMRVNPIYIYVYICVYVCEHV